MIRALRVMLILTVIFFSVSVSPARSQFFFFENPLIGEAAPNFTLNTVTQKAVNFSSYRAGKPAIVFFWATWCPHCRVQLKEIQKHETEYIKKGLKMVLVDVGESPFDVKAYMKRQGLNMDVFLDRNSTVSEAYGVIGLPTFYLVDRGGIIRAVEHEIPSNYEEFLSVPEKQVLPKEKVFSPQEKKNLPVEKESRPDEKNVPPEKKAAPPKEEKSFFEKVKSFFSR